MKKWMVASLFLVSAGAMAQIGGTNRVSVGAPLPPNAETNRIGLSQSGHYVVYETLADNIVGGDFNGARDIFLHDWSAGITEIVSITGQGLSSNGDSYRADVNGNGRFIVFQSAATNIVPGDTS